MSSPTSQIMPATSKTADRLAAACLTVLIFAVFARALPFPFLNGWDDDIYVLGNVARLRFTAANVRYWLTASHLGNYHPLTMFSYMLDHALWGLAPAGYRLQNLLWHTVATLAFFACLRHFRVRPGIAAFFAAVFAVHPQRVESVVWIAERKDVLCAAFYLLALLAFLRRDRSSPRAHLAPFFLFLAALFAKAMAISLPCLLFFCDWQASGNRDPRPALRRTAPYLLVAAAFVPVTIWAQGTAIQPFGGMLTRLGVVWHNVFWYAGALFFPRRLAPIYATVVPDTAMLVGLAAATAATALGLAAGWRCNRRLTYSVAVPVLAAYAAVLAPVSGIVPLGAIDHADRYAYLPGAVLLAGLAFGAEYAYARGGAVTGAAGRRLAMPVLAGLVIINYAVRTWTYSAVFRHARSVFSRSCDRPRPNPVALGQWAELELQAGRYAYVRALADRLAAGAAEPRVAAFYASGYRLKAAYLRAAADYRAGKPAAALKQFVALYHQLDADVPPTMFSLDTLEGMMADSYARLGDKERAVKIYTRLLSRTPTSFSARLNRGVLLFEAGQYAAAAADFRAALAARPRDRIARHNLAQALAKVSTGDSGGLAPGRGSPVP